MVVISITGSATVIWLERIRVYSRVVIVMIVVVTFICSVVA